MRGGGKREGRGERGSRKGEKGVYLRVQVAIVG